MAKRNMAKEMGKAFRMMIEKDADKLGVPKDSPLRKVNPITVAAIRRDGK